jgi:RNA-directed DNA polymerase
LFPALDSFIRRRLRSILCKQNGWSYCYNRSYLTHQKWPNAFFAELGLFTMKEAWLMASRSR